EISLGAPVLPTITTTTLPGGAVDTAYSQTLAATGTTPIIWSMADGSDPLPGGLTLTGNIISGTPTTVGTFNFTVKATNATGSDTQALSIVISAAPPVNKAPVRKSGVDATAEAGVTVNTAYTLDLATIFEDANADTLTYKVSVNGAADTGANASYSYTPASTGTTTLVFKANDGMVDSTDTYTVTLTANAASSGGGDSNPTTPPNTSPAETPKTETTITGNTATATTTTTATVDNNGKATAAVTQEQVSDAISQALAQAQTQGDGTAATVEIKVDAPADATTVETSIPKEAMKLAADGKTAALTVSTPIASISFDVNALSTISGEAAEDVKITASKVEASSLSEETQQLVGDRPVFNFSVTSGDTTISQFGGNVSVAVPYTPKAGEDTNAIVIYYINAEGKPEIVRNCVYDPVTGTVSFSTNHFSQYAVGYNKVSFKDVPADVWYSKAVVFIAARGITTGTGNGNYSPDARLTRGEFLVMMLRAYGIAPDTDLTNNFADAGNTYYTGYLAAAKRLGISEGVGNNMFAPGKEITRQEMFTLLYNALKVIGQLPQGNSGKTLSSFSDAGQIASWAKDAIALLVQTEAIGGNNGKLSPTSTATRVEMAQVLYNLLSNIETK
ncbi:MAG TPA: S-layer homology domain-containing protein, partial [Clostridia bacterium]|nr:S-layer homology domain-containing protein [Clostridia bacterium]